MPERVDWELLAWLRSLPPGQQAEAVDSILATVAVILDESWPRGLVCQKN